MLKYIRRENRLERRSALTGEDSRFAQQSTPWTGSQFSLKHLEYINSIQQIDSAEILHPECATGDGKREAVELIVISLPVGCVSSGTGEIISVRRIVRRVRS